MKKIYRLVFFLSIICCALLICSRGINAKDSSFFVQYIDVGQGDCALIQCDGHYMLIDGGDSSQSSKIFSILKKNGIDTLDVIIATHPDSDHIGGLSGALNYSKVKKAYCSVKEHDTKQFNSFKKYLNKQNVDITIPKVGSNIKLGSATVTFLGPVEITDDTNNSSIVVKIKYGDNSFLFMGDAEEDEEKALINEWGSIECDVLKVAHHGSSSSCSGEFLKKVMPKYAIISVGKNNSYSHPTQETLDKLKNIDAVIYRTDLQGDITVSSNGKKLSFATVKSAKQQDIQKAPVKDTDDGNSDDNGKRDSTTGCKYVLNTRSHKFHYPTCDSVNDMKAKNREDSNLTRDEIIKAGYVPCKRCNP